MTYEECKKKLINEWSYDKLLHYYVDLYYDNDDFYFLLIGNPGEDGSVAMWYSEGGYAFDILTKEDLVYEILEEEGARWENDGYEDDLTYEGLPTDDYEIFLDYLFGDI